MKHIVIFVCIAAFVALWFSFSILDHFGNKLIHLSRLERCFDTPFFNSTTPRHCAAKRDIFFLKTHKCASSTVQNILMRFGERNQLNIVLPPDGNYLGHPQLFDRKMAMPLVNNASFNLFCHHTRFHQKEVESLMPPDTIFITILRDPVTLFESLYAYFDLHQRWNLDLESVPRVSPSVLPRAQDRFGRNQMSFDLGLSSIEFDAPIAVKRFIHRLNRRFDLVMIAEKFDESLILLKDLLCWDIEDVIYFRQNARLDTAKIEMNESLVKKLRKLNNADEQLYRFFLKRFEEKVEKYGREKLEEETKNLRQWNSRWHDYCVEREAATANQQVPAQFRTWSDKVLGFHLRPGIQSHLCESMAKTEIAFTRELRRQQVLRQNAPSSTQFFALFRRLSFF